jgi:predicted membrane protein
VITLEGWSKLVYNYSRSINPAIVSIYFVLIVFIGSFILLNLMLAVIYTVFREVTENEKRKESHVKSKRKESRHRSNMLKLDSVNL